MIKLRTHYQKRLLMSLPKTNGYNYLKIQLKLMLTRLLILLQERTLQREENFEFKKADDIKQSDLDFWVANDVDADPEMDAVLGGKKTPAGTKMTVFGQDGSSVAKRVGIVRMIKLMKTRGFYAELDMDLATKLGLEIIKDEAEIRKVLNKDVKMNSDGSYDRKLTDGPVKTKVLVGIPKV